MIKTITIVVLGLVVSAQALQGQDRSRYRDFYLGENVLSVSALTKAAATDAKIFHQRPALMQELEWQPPYVSRRSTAPQDPVRHIVFSFYNDQLSKMVVDYDQERTAGMTDADMIDAISTIYGTRLKPATPKTRPAASRIERESGTPITRWGDADYSVVLYRSSDVYRLLVSPFRIIVLSPRLDSLARTAEAQALRLDEREAPQREIATTEGSRRRPSIPGKGATRE